MPPTNNLEDAQVGQDSNFIKKGNEDKTCGTTNNIINKRLR